MYYTFPKRSAIAAALLFAFMGVTSTLAQTRPPNLQPVPEPPPPPKGYELDGSLEPQISTIKRGEDIVEEYRLGGRLYMMKITPSHGIPYYLVDHRGDGQFARQTTHDTGLRPPMWVIHSF